MSDSSDDDRLCGRRRLLFGATVVAVTPLLGFCGLAGAAPAMLSFEPVSRSDALDWKDVLLAGDRTILMRRDGPTQRVRYADRHGRLDREGYLSACHLLRDVHAGQTVQIDPQLLDVLCGIQRWMDFNGKLSTIEITSGFRSAATNRAAEGAARHSMHLYGKAADIVVPGAPSAMIGAMVRRFNSDGGTGIYPGREFVHVDTGEARSWISASPTRPAPRLRLRRRRRR